MSSPTSSKKLCPESVLPSMLIMSVLFPCPSEPSSPGLKVSIKALKFSFGLKMPMFLFTSPQQFTLFPYSTQITAHHHRSESHITISNFLFLSHAGVEKFVKKTNNLSFTQQLRVSS